MQQRLRSVVTPSTWELLTVLLMMLCLDDRRQKTRLVPCRRAKENGMGVSAGASGFLDNLGAVNVHRDGSGKMRLCQV